MCNKLAKVDFEQWNGFKGDRWKEKIDVRNFISMNYTPYDGDASFLEAPTEATDKLWGKLQELQKEERAKGGVLDMETEVVTGITVGVYVAEALVPFMSSRTTVTAGAIPTNDFSGTKVTGTGEKS